MRVGLWPLLPFCMVALAGALGCTDWLEVDDGSEDEAQAVAVVPLTMPSEPPLLDAPGPLVPRTPGLRVPLAGYWTRVRLDALDAIFPYSWASLDVAGGGARGDAFAVLRLEGSSIHGDEPSEIGAQGVSGLHAVVPIALPSGTDASVIRDGFELAETALTQATVGLRTASQDLYLITLTRLTFDKVTKTLIAGSIEGAARRGAQGQRVRAFNAVFLALRAPADEP